MDLADLTADDFEPLLHDPFRVGDFEVELSEVNRSGNAGDAREQFSLTFEGGPEQPLPQQIYRVEHERLGAIEIFVVPIAAGRYEAVFT